MRSVADDLRKRTADAVLRLPVSERMALSLRLGDEDAALFAAARGISVGDARRQLSAQRRHGRRPSVAAGNP